MSATPGTVSTLFERSCGRALVGYLSGESALTQTSTSATDAKMPRADRIMSAFVPVITTAVTTAMRTVITVAQTRRGERSMVAAASAPTDPNTLAVAAVALTMGPASAKPSAISAQNRADIAATAMVPVRPRTIRIDTAKTTTAPTPIAIRSQRGTRSATETPTGASASIGETLYTCRAAIADATTLASTVAVMAMGIA